MTIRFEAKVDASGPVGEPDWYVPSDAERPSVDFVVSRNPDGTVASRYGELAWNISNWDLDGHRQFLHFEFWKGEISPISRNIIIDDARWLVFVLVWIRDGSPLKVTTIKNYMGVIRSLARHSDLRRVRITDLLTSESELNSYLQSCSWAQAKTLSGLFSHFDTVDMELLGFPLLENRARKPLRKILRQSKDVCRQTPPIPSRIYLSILNSLRLELDNWQKVAGPALLLLRACGRDPCYGRRESAQQMKAQVGHARTSETFWEDVAPPEVRDYLRANGHQDNVAGLSSAVTQVQMACKLIMHAYSGMRDKECTSLPYDCSEVYVSSGIAHRLIRGRTTKFAKASKRTKWVTNTEGHRSIMIASEIARAIYEVFNVNPSLSKTTRARSNSHPLFVSVAYLGFGGGVKAVNSQNPKFLPGGFGLDQHEKLLARLQPLIEDADLDELEQIDEFRAWREEPNFQIGKPWALGTHQLRRSLALYAQRSGLVSIPSLRRQLQHLTDSMTFFYTAGSLYAKSIFGHEQPDDGHFCIEWRLSQHESEGISYAINVLTTADTLFGGHAQFVERRIAGEGGVVSRDTRQHTLRLFKQGELAYHETLIGGCTRIGECDRPAVDWMNLGCLTSDCGNMVGSLPKLDKVIAEQSLLVNSLSTSTLLYRTESALLEKLHVARRKYVP